MDSQKDSSNLVSIHRPTPGMGHRQLRRGIREKDESLWPFLVQVGGAYLHPQHRATSRRAASRHTPEPSVSYGRSRRRSCLRYFLQVPVSASWALSTRRRSRGCTSQLASVSRVSFVEELVTFQRRNLVRGLCPEVFAQLCDAAELYAKAALARLAIRNGAPLPSDRITRRK